MERLVSRSWGQLVNNLFTLHRDRDDLLGVEVHFHEIHHSDLSVIIGAEVEALPLEVIGGGPGGVVGQDIAVVVFFFRFS